MDPTEIKILYTPYAENYQQFSSKNRITQFFRTLKDKICLLGESLMALGQSLYYRSDIQVKQTIEKIQNVETKLEEIEQKLREIKQTESPSNFDFVARKELKDTWKKEIYQTLTNIDKDNLETKAANLWSFTIAVDKSKRVYEQLFSPEASVIANTVNNWARSAFPFQDKDLNKINEKKEEFENHLFQKFNESHQLDKLKGYTNLYNSWNVANKSDKSKKWFSIVAEDPKLKKEFYEAFGKDFMVREVRHYFALHDLANGYIIDQAATQQLLYDFSEGNVSIKEEASLEDTIATLYPTIMLQLIDLAPLDSIIDDLFNNVVHLDKILTEDEQKFDTEMKKTIIEKKLSDPKERKNVWDIISSHVFRQSDYANWISYDAIIQLKTRNIRDPQMIQQFLFTYTKNGRSTHFLDTLANLFPPKDYNWKYFEGILETVDLPPT